MKVEIYSTRDSYLDNKSIYVSMLVACDFHITIEKGISYIYIYNIEDIFKIHDILNKELIIANQGDFSIEIYDDYRE